MASTPRRRNGKKLIFVKWFRHWRTGKIIRRPDGRPFAIWVDDN